MYIINKTRDSIINAARATAIYIGEDRTTVKAICGNADKMYRLGAYKTREYAEIALREISKALARTDISCCVMPDDSYVESLARELLSDKSGKFAANGKKTKRRGGS